MPNYRLRKGTVQDGFSRSRSKIQVMGGAFANGKTTAGVIKVLSIVEGYPGSENLVARETYPKLNDTVRKVFYRWTPPGWVRKWPTQEDNSMYFNNGSVVHFRYIAQKGKTSEDGSTTSNLLSAAYDSILVDQMEDPGITYKDFLDLMGRCRGETPYNGDDPTMPKDGPRFVMLTLNPTRNWVYHKLIHPYLVWKESGGEIRLPDLIVDPSTKQPIIELFESDVYANKENLKADYIMGLEATYKGQMHDRYVKGAWVAFEGLVHDGFDDRRHRLSQAQMEAHLDDCIRRHVKIVTLEAYDFGVTSPSCYLLGFVDDWGRVFIIDGFYEPGLSYTEHPGRIREIRAKYSGRLFAKEPIMADPGIWKKTVVVNGQATTTESIANLLQGLGLVMRPASNEILAGIAKVNAYLNGMVEVPHVITGDIPGPLLYTAFELEWIQREISAYYWKKNPYGDSIDEPVDRNDHAMNCMKYLLSRQPEPSQIVLPTAQRRREYMFWHEMDMTDYNRAMGRRR